MDAEPTIFDQILNGNLPADVVYEDSSVLAFRDINPRAPVHVLVIPKKRAADLRELKDWSSPEVGDFFAAVSRTASVLGLDEPGYRVVLNTGNDGGQDVPYLHAHILGGRRMSWPPG